MTSDLESQLDQLEQDGFLLIEGALCPNEITQIRQRIEHARAMGWEEGLNEVGNMWFDSLLDREPDNFGPLVGHHNVRPYLQEWHMDFYGYWEEKSLAARSRLAVPPAGVNTTFYFQDNDPGEGHLKFIKNGHLTEPPHLFPKPMDRPKFEAWCEAQEHVALYPKAGDCVIFLSHIPHQGAKERDDMERSNVVCHYQLTPMHEGAWHVSRSRGWAGTFPLVAT